jgi:hypothetical protein
MSDIEQALATAEGIALGQVVLAAPDVGARFFGAEAGAHRSVADGTTPAPAPSTEPPAPASPRR